MAIIVKLPAPRQRSVDTATIEAGATILFFTGVRYEREVEIEADPEALGDLMTVSPADATSAVVAI